MSEIGFINKKKENKNHIVKKNFENAICFGKTGTGKTSSFILPNIEERIKSGYGILAFDYKGNMHKYIKHIANKYGKLNEVLEIGKPWGVNINLLDCLNENIIEESFKGSSNKDFFETAAKELFKNLFLVFKNLVELINLNVNLPFEKKIGKIKYLKKLFNSPEKLSNFLKYSEEYIENSQILLDNKIINNKINKETGLHYFNTIMILKELLSDLEEYKNLNNNGEIGGKYGIINFLNSLLPNSFSKEYLNDSEIDIIQKLNEGKIIIVNQEEIDSITSTYLNKYIFNNLKDRINDNKVHPVTIFVDELHKVISNTTIPETSICRESFFEYIMSVQNEEMLKEQLNDSEIKKLISNVRTKIVYNGNFKYQKNEDPQIIESKPLFFKKDDLNKIEYKFQNENQKIKTYNLKKNEYLGYSKKLMENNKCFKEILFKDLKKEIKIIFNKEIFNKYIKLLMEQSKPQEIKIIKNITDVKDYLIKQKQYYFQEKYKYYTKKEKPSIKEIKKIQLLYKEYEHIFDLSESLMIELKELKELKNT